MASAETLATLRQAKQAIRDKYAWPGGYPLYLVMGDCAALCVACGRKEWRQIARHTIAPTHGRDWQCVAIDTNWENPDLYCVHCSERIESAYAEPESVPEFCPRFNVTYEIVTPESAEHGDAEEQGFAAEGVRLREAWEAMGREATQNSGRWIDNHEYGEDYQSGGRESRAIHPPKNITDSSYRRLLRLFGLKPDNR